MAKQNRDTLKKYFKEGALPSSDQFGDLIDSALNLVDEVFDKSQANGLEVSSLGDDDRLISFFRSEDSEHRPLWSITYDRDKDKLLFNRWGYDRQAEHETSPVMALAPDGNVGINNKDPGCELDVGGVVRAIGRVGVPCKKRTSEAVDHTVPADGGWHDITPVLNGCHALEVMAGAGRKRTGKYALMHAVAMNAHNPTGWFFNFLNKKKRIKYQHAYYRSAGNKLKLRWDKRGTGYCLQLRANSSYGDNTPIRYYITQLWFHEDMSDYWSVLNLEVDDQE